MDRMRSLFGPTRYLIAPLLSLFLPKKVRQWFAFKSQMVCHSTPPTDKCGRNCCFCQKQDLGGEFVKETHKVGVDFCLWNTRGISFWEGSGFFPDNHTGDGAFTVLSKFKDDVDVFKMIKCFLGFKSTTSGQEMKDWWKRDTEITNFVKELTFTYYPKSATDASNRPELLLDGEIPHKPIGIADILQHNTSYEDCKDHDNQIQIPPIQQLSCQVDELLFLCHRHLLPVFGAGVDRNIPSWDPASEKKISTKCNKDSSKQNQFFDNILGFQNSDDNNNDDSTSNNVRWQTLSCFVFILLFAFVGFVSIFCYSCYWQ